jgi:hypothetical protein
VAEPGDVLTLRAAAPPPAAPEPAPRTARGPGVNLREAAAVCTAISRVTDAGALPDVLARAAAVIDAAGIIVWLSAGEELFAVAGHGYSPAMLGRLGPIARNTDNATAAAWRRGELRTVAGDTTSPGAIVAPMFGPECCMGVLAAEVRHGRETDTATQAVTSLIASQLATIVTAWPPARAGAAPAGDPAAANA